MPWGRSYQPAGVSIVNGFMLFLGNRCGRMGGVRSESGPSSSNGSVRHMHG